MIHSGFRSPSGKSTVELGSGCRGQDKKSVEMKKGAGASPLFVIDAPKPVTESRIGSGHPGKPIFYVTNQRANHVPATDVPE
jgi:hypothetical protein